VLVAANFVIAVGYGIVAPALPTFARSFNVSVTAASAVVSAFAVSRLLFAPISGRLVTRLGERRVYLVGVLVVAVTTGICAFVTEYWQLVALRAVGGIGSTMFTVSSVALLVRVTPAPQRGRASGLWGTGFLLGNVTGPLVGGGLITISLRAPFLVYAVTLVVAVAIAAVFLQRSALIEPDGTEPLPPVTLREAARHSGFVAAMASSFANGWTVFGVRVALMPLFITEVLHQPDAFAGTALAVFAAANVVMLLASGRLSDAVGRRSPAIGGLVLTAGGMGWMAFTESVPLFLAATVLAGLGSGLLNPAQQAAVADVIGSDGRGGGSVLASFQMAADVGAIFGPIAAGALADSLGFPTALTVTAALSGVAAVFWLAARETRPAS
jgi:MFS family permease